MTRRNLRANGPAIRGLREVKGLTIGNLAERSGRSYRYISNIELGVKQPSEATLKAIAKALRVPTAAIVEGGGIEAVKIFAQQIGVDLAAFLRDAA